MIIRGLRVRHGRITPSKPPYTPGCPRRFYANEPPSETLQDTAVPPLHIPNPFLNRPRNGLTPAGTSEAQEDGRDAQSDADTDLRSPNHPIARQWAFFQHQNALTKSIGTDLLPHYRPLDLVENPPSINDISLELLMASQSHLGHATCLWNPANARYIFGIRDGVHIISLDVTAAHLRRASKIVREVAARAGLILFVGTRKGQARAVIRAAELSGGYHLFDKWIPGGITNGQQILGKCAMKVVDEHDKEFPVFKPQLREQPVMKPDLVVCLNPTENYILLHECGLSNIPTIGVIDTDANPTWVTYPIPANDDSLRCMQLIVGALGRAGEEGRQLRLDRATNGKIDYPIKHGLTEPEDDTLNDEEEESRDRERAEALTEAKLADDAGTLGFVRYNLQSGQFSELETLDSLPEDEAVRMQLSDFSELNQVADKELILEVMKRNGLDDSMAEGLEGITQRDLEIWEWGRRDPSLYILSQLDEE